MVFDSMEPIGERRGDYRNALLMCLLANIHRDSKKSPYKVEDFLPKYDISLPKKQKPEEMLRIVKQYAAVVGGLKSCQ